MFVATWFDPITDPQGWGINWAAEASVCRQLPGPFVRFICSIGRRDPVPFDPSWWGSSDPCLPGEWEQKQGLCQIPLGVCLALLGTQSSTLWWVGHIPPMSLHSFLLPQETWSHFWRIFSPVLGTFIFITNCVTHMHYTMARANRAIYSNFRITRFCLGNLSLQGRKPASGLPLSLYIWAARFAFTQNTHCLQILCVFTHLGRVLCSLCSLFTNSFSIVSAFPPCFQGLFQLIPGWYVHLVYAPWILHQLV